MSALDPSFLSEFARHAHNIFTIRVAVASRFKGSDRRRIKREVNKALIAAGYSLHTRHGG